MDRSYLSDPAVVAASRKFICVRLVTYEDVSEMAFMKSIFDFRTPTKNSLFAILDPTATKHLVDPGRSMKFTFDDAAKMATRMNAIAETFPGKKQRGNKTGKVQPDQLGLPYLKDVRVALNVAACDTQSLVILYAPKATERKRLEAVLKRVVWHEDVIGDFLYATTDQLSDLANITDVAKTAGLLVVVPDAYGLKARQVAFVPLGTHPADARVVLVAAAKAHRMGSKDSKRHIGRGRRQGVRWQPVVDDPGLKKRRRKRR
jgi:hypothetical protein